MTEAGRTWTRAEFEEEISRVADRLREEATGGPVTIDLPSGSAFLATFLAASAVGRPACTLHQDWARPELEAAIADVGGFEPDPDDDDPVFYIGFTSGTSGRPKPFVRSRNSWTSSFGAAGELFSIEDGDEVFLPGSMQHSHFLFGAVLALNRGAGVRLFEEFDAARLMGELRVTGRGVVYLVPTMLLALDDLGGEAAAGVHSLVVSGAKMEAHHWEIARRLFPGASVGEIYGASELSFVAVNTEGERPSDPGYVGQLFPGVEVEIRPPGVVHVRSPYLFDGYLEDSGLASPIGEDGFMTVGDMGVLDADGLSLSGRASNLLITGGKNVHPEEVEAALGTHPAVRECVVAGMPDPRWGDEIVAFMVPADPRTPPDPEELRRYLKELIASYKVPKRWFVVDGIPRTRAGKTDRSRDRLMERATRL